MFMVELAEKYGVARARASYLLSVTGITNCTGRLVAGWLANRKTIQALGLYVTACLVGGGATMACPHLRSYTTLAAYAAVFGCFVGQGPVLNILDKLINSYLQHVMSPCAPSCWSTCLASTNFPTLLGCSTSPEGWPTSSVRHCPV
jgi:predicted MFS family arabinose efflux permease